MLLVAGTFLLALFLGLGTAEPTRDYLVEGSARDGRIFGKRFWDGLERGIQDTAGIVSRVSGNLEVAFDQMADEFSDNLNSFADKIERRVGDSLPPFIRDSPESGASDSFKIDAIGGSLGGGVDDGLEVFYPKEGDVIEEPVRVTKVDKDVPVEVFEEDAVEKPSIDFDVDKFLNPFLPFGNGNSGLFNIFRRRTPWWKGDYVCMDKEEIDDKESNTQDGVKVEAEVVTEKKGEDSDKSAFNFFSNLQMSSCRDTGEKYSCVTSSTTRGIHKTVKVTYRCCHGFVRDGYGCIKIDIAPMPKTLETLGTTSDFLSLVKAADLMEMITSSNLTIFAPTNEAISEFTADLEEKNEIQNNIGGLKNDIYRKKREVHNLTPTLMGHMTDGFIYAGDLRDEMVLPSLNEKSTLRVNIYKGYPPSVTVNCARIIKANQHSLNGVVHTLDRVIDLAEKSIAEIIATDPQFSIFNRLLTQSGVAEDLGKEGQMTLFAPTDAAFRRLAPSVLESLFEGSSCLQEVVKQHILPNTICSTAIQGKMKTLNILDAFLVVERDDDDKLLVEGAHIVAHDLVGTNGVVHIIDKALIPSEAKSISEVLELHNLTRFMDLLRLAELGQELDGKRDITVFAPSNRAIENFPEADFEKLKNDKEALKELLRYHVTTPALKARDINNNQLTDTVSGHPLRINLYSGAPILSDLINLRSRYPVKVTAGCSRVSMLDSRACGAVVHIIEDVLEVPRSNVLESLNQEKFSLFKQMIHDTGLNKELEGEGPYTLLVPSDHALKTLPEEELNEILKDEKLKEKLVKRHILQEHVCCSGINGNNWIFMDRKRTMDGSSIHMRRSPSGRLMAGPARITECGMPTANGVIHTVNRMVMDDREFGDLAGERRTGDGLKIFRIPNFERLFF